MSMVKNWSFGNFYLPWRFWWRQRKELTYPSQSLILEHSPSVCASHRLTWWAGVGKALRWIFCCTEKQNESWQVPEMWRSWMCGVLLVSSPVSQEVIPGQAGLPAGGRQSAKMTVVLRWVCTPFTRKNKCLCGLPVTSHRSLFLRLGRCVSPCSPGAAQSCAVKKSAEWVNTVLQKGQQLGDPLPPAPTFWSVLQCMATESPGMLHNKLMSALSPLSISGGKPWEGFSLSLLTEVGFFPISEINVHCWHLNEDNSDVC